MADSKLSALTQESVPSLADFTYVIDVTPTSLKQSWDRILGLTPAICTGRLTTETGVPVSTSDRTAQGTIYFTPYNGAVVALYDGTRWRVYVLTERSLALTVTSGKNYDVFLYDNAGTLTLELSAAWTTDIARADALALQDGIFCKSGALTRRWIGTIRASGANVTEDSAGGTTTQVGGKRFVWNVYNQVLRHLSVFDSTNSWAYGTATTRQANAASGNKVEYVTGDAALYARAQVLASAFLSINTTFAAIAGVGVDSTTVFSGLLVGGFESSAAGSELSLLGRYYGQPGLGYHALNWCERGAAGTTSTFIGDDGTAANLQQSGLQAEIMA